MEIAKENEEARTKLIEEEQHRASFVEHLWISRWVCTDDLNTAKDSKLQSSTFSHFCWFWASLILFMFFSVFTYSAPSV